MRPTLPRLLTARDLPEVELQAAALDGHVCRVADSWASIVDPDDAWRRAEALAEALGPIVVGARGTAAWIWGARAAAPRRLEAVVPSSARHHVDRADLTVGEVLIDDDEITQLGRVRVTSPTRTVLDLLRADDWSGDAERLVRTLLVDHHVDPRQVAALVRRHGRLPGRRRAANRLRTLVDPLVV
ncbi:type IV toxin-antitoxin system AbiEi family antitoxin [Frigoribacterium sp. PvP032]|uniref:type IV toxin-antitoxin system AbiEi family antitoxin n=1 Tax=Frigoribacterium sp. PvP032 TaxID=2806589 RepID=UPI001AE10BD9|nr:type IV toxin-antitoxin system AbiEi family antitoxin [Frigoribacterium sp. PvP032]MBP1190767.1 hypothetical protein [Frigoribacterium sp. PvP032]